MSDATLKARAGDLICFTWTEVSGQPYPTYINKHEAFIAALIRSGLLVSVAVTEHHLGSYGVIDL